MDPVVPDAVFGSKVGSHLFLQPVPLRECSGCQVSRFIFPYHRGRKRVCPNSFQISLPTYLAPSKLKAVLNHSMVSGHPSLYDTT